MSITRQDAPQQNNSVFTQQGESSSIDNPMRQYHNAPPQYPQSLPPIFGNFPNGPKRLPAPTGSVMDNTDLFLGLAKREENDVMSRTLRTIVNDSLMMLPGQITIRCNDVVFISSNYTYDPTISLPSGKEINVPGMSTISAVMMQMVDLQTSENDIIAFAGAIDSLVSAMRDRQKAQETPIQESGE